MKRPHGFAASTYPVRGATSGPTGPTGSPGPFSEIVESAPFTFATSSPLVLEALAPRSIINRAILVVRVAFDDPSATIELGTTADPSLVFGPSDCRLSEVHSIDYASYIEIAVVDLFILTIQPGASTQGSGQLLYKILR